ncbi:protein of unknown function DUF1320 [Desulfatibacillum aliphaticivorans]|uniref:DUF1320 domain-containing protein n=1 Tax=Desulfatibacillum aliphaticivorans TaxID=218208 RepID=B8FC34_DESAL|nr:DUF1320 domain-containing protein [Desulfatibacillum aliphaticivorans]ACL05239.1 protein of unknown function DUF1320 [Desulfatibacillum aliphaticivorans]
MAYSTISDILVQLDEQTLIQLTDDAGLGAVNQSVVSAAIEDADSEIDSYCGSRYDVPLSTATGMIGKISVDIALHNLWSRRSQGPPDSVEKRYANAVRFLRDVSAGKVTLGANAPTEPESSGPRSTTDKADRIFTQDTLRDF